MRKIGTPGRPRSADNLDDRLRRLLQTKETVERTFREENQKLWGILFLDASGSAEEVWKLGPETADEIFAEYQIVARAALAERSPTFVDPAGGPQLIACYETPHDALESADSVLRSLEHWGPNRDPRIRLTPAIGAHLGYLVYKDGKLLQSNTANMTKRIQTQAQPGQILVSEQLYEALKDTPEYQFEHLGAFALKNIPEPQDLYEARFGFGASFNARPSAAHRSARTHAATSTAVTDEKKSHVWALVYIDVCESTKKFWSYGDRQAIRLIEEYQKLCTTTFNANRCAYQLSCEGDQIFAGFEPDNIDGAIASSIQIMQTLFRRNMNVPNNQKVQAALGIHLGEVIFQGAEMMQTRDTRVGKSVQSLATADEILLTEEVLNMAHPDFRQIVEEYDACTFEGLPDQYEVYKMKWTRLQLSTTHLRKILGTSSPSMYRKR